MPITTLKSFLSLNHIMSSKNSLKGILSSYESFIAIITQIQIHNLQNDTTVIQIVLRYSEGVECIGVGIAP